MKKLLTAAAAVALTTAALPAFAATRQVVGTLMFQDAVAGDAPYTPLTSRPIRYVTVRLKVNGTLVGTTQTNSSGEYSIFIDQSLLPVGQQLTVEYQSENYAADVKLDLDYFDDELIFSGLAEIPDPQWLMFLDDTVTIAEFSQHMSILDAITYGRQYADIRREDSDDISNVEVQYPDAEGTHYQGSGEDITVSGPSAYGYGWDTATGQDSAFFDADILHEYGHHVMHEISDDDSSGGDHGFCTDKGYAFAWSEGWATYFAASVRAASPPNVFESGSFFDFESWLPSDCPPSSELITLKILWDLFDPANESFDVVNGAWIGYSGKTLADTMFGVVDVEQDDAPPLGGPPAPDPPTSIMSFHNHLVARNPFVGSHADIDRVYFGNDVFPHQPAEFSVSSVVANPITVIAGHNVNLTMTLNNSGGVAYTDQDLRVYVTFWPFGGTEQVIDTFLVPASLGSQVISRSVNVPSSVPQGSQPFFVRVDPLDRFAESNESNNSRFFGLDIVTCGNGVCSVGESCSSCSADCGSCNKCGNGVCSSTESCTSCPADCGPCGFCGDGLCQGKETKKNCKIDCGPPGP